MQECLALVFYLVSMMTAGAVHESFDKVMKLVHEYQYS